MKENILNIETIHECNCCLGYKTLHPLVSVIDLGLSGESVLGSAGDDVGVSVNVVTGSHLSGQIQAIGDGGSTSNLTSTPLS